LAHDPALAATATPTVEVAGPPVDVTRPQPDSNLPVPAAPLIGRTTEVDATASLVRQHRIVTVVGPGGVGKTRVAIEAARSLRREFDDGVQLVELAPVGDAADVSTAVASALGVEAEVGAGASTKPLERLSEFLAGRHMLLVLDNCEHVVGEAARLVEHVAGRCPELHVIATSREPLMIGGEALWPLAPLELDSAVALFMARAHAVAPAFETTPVTSATVRDICDRLDCLPLAIELAAARMRAFTPTELYSRLDDRFRLLTGGARTAFPRQQTLRAVTDWSYDLLFENERRVFERVSVFASWFNLAAAEAVCADETVAQEEVAELLARLIDKSLLVSASNAHGVKYRLLQTLAQYGRERLRARGDDEATRTRHARYVAGYVEVPDAVHGDIERHWFLKVAMSLDDIRAATEWAIATGDADLACALTTGLGWFWNMGGRLDDTWRWLTEAVALGPTEDPTRRVRALAWAGSVGIVPDTEQALAYGWDAVALAREIGDPAALAIATTLHASALSDFFHRTAVPIVLFEESRQAYEAVGDPWSLAMASIVRGAILLVQGDFDRAFPELRSGADQFGALGNAWGRSIALRNLADVATTKGRYIEAISALRDAISGLRAVGAVGVSSGLTARLAYLHALQGDDDEAEVWFEQALADAEKQRYVPTFALTYNLRGIAWRRQERYDEAEQCHRRALALYYERGAHAGVSLTLASLGYLAELRGDVVTAEAHHRASLDAACEAEDPRAQALALEGLAGVASLRGDDETVGRLLGAANALREATGGPLVSVEYDDVARAVGRVSRPEAMTAGYTVAARDPAAVIAAVRDVAVVTSR
jgi:predicted ATPase